MSPTPIPTPQPPITLCVALLIFVNLEGMRANPDKDYIEVKVSLDGPDAPSQESAADATQTSADGTPTSRKAGETTAK